MSTIKYSRLLTNTFKNIVLAALIVDDAEQNPIHNLGSDNGIFSKYIDLSATKTGDYNKILKELGTLPQLEGILLDNVDKIPKNKDREYWEEFVRFALKKEPDFPLPGGASISFDKIHVAARCKDFPDYLKGRSLQCYIISKDTI